MLGHFGIDDVILLEYTSKHDSIYDKHMTLKHDCQRNKESVKNVNVMLYFLSVGKLHKYYIT